MLKSKYFFKSPWMLSAYLTVIILEFIQVKQRYYVYGYSPQDSWEFLGLFWMYLNTSPVSSFHYYFAFVLYLLNWLVCTVMLGLLLKQLKLNFTWRLYAWLSPLFSIALLHLVVLLIFHQGSLLFLPNYAQSEVICTDYTLSINVIFTVLDWKLVSCPTS